MENNNQKQQKQRDNSDSNKKESTNSGGNDDTPSTSSSMSQSPNPNGNVNLTATTTTPGAYLGLNTATKRIIFFGYIAFWVTHSMLIYTFRKHRSHLNFTTVAGLIELAKLSFSLVAFFKQDYVNMTEIKLSVVGPLFLKYIIPAFLYAVYNNLAYVILSMTDPGTHSILGNARTLLTAVVWRYAFSKAISNDKWKALLLVTGGCVIKGLETFTPESSVNLLIIGLISTQIITATAAGVYMEFLLKSFKDIPVNFQNSLMYINCILGNVIIMVLRQLFGSGSGMFGSGDGIQIVPILTDPFALTVIIFGAMAGMSTGFFLRYLDSVLKTIATSIELLLLPFVSMIFFGTEVRITTFIAVLCVAQGTLLYSKSEGTTPSINNGERCRSSRYGASCVIVLILVASMYHANIFLNENSLTLNKVEIEGVSGNKEWDTCALEGELGYNNANLMFPKWGSKSTNYSSCQYQKDQPGLTFTLFESGKLSNELSYLPSVCPPIPTQVPKNTSLPNSWPSYLAGALVGPAEFTLGVYGKKQLIWKLLDRTQYNVFEGHEHHEYVFARCKVVYPGQEDAPLWAMNAHTRVVPRRSAVKEVRSYAATSTTGSSRKTRLFPNVVVLGGESQTRHGMQTSGKQASTCLKERFGPAGFKTNIRKSTNGLFQSYVSDGEYTYFDFSDYHPAGQYTVHSVPPLYSGRQFLSIPENCETCMFELFKRNGFVTWGSDSMRFSAESSINTGYAMGGKRPAATNALLGKSSNEETSDDAKGSKGGTDSKFGIPHHWFQNTTMSSIPMCNNLKQNSGTCSYCDSYGQGRHHCFGPKLIEEYHLSHLLQFLRAYDNTGNKGNPIPKFAFHSNDANHWCNPNHGAGWKGNYQQVYNDAGYSFHLFLSKLMNDFDSEELPLIIFVGDHGPAAYDIGNKRHDDVLMQLLVPNHILKAHPEIAVNLKANQDKLLGPYDIYEVLHWLATGVTTKERPLRKVPADEVWQTHFLDKEGKEKKLKLTGYLPPLNGSNIPQNFFTSKVSAHRSPVEAGLPKNVWRP